MKNFLLSMVFLLLLNTFSIAEAEEIKQNFIDIHKFSESFLKQYSKTKSPKLFDESYFTDTATYEFEIASLKQSFAIEEINKRLLDLSRTNPVKYLDIEIGDIKIDEYDDKAAIIFSEKFTTQRKNHENKPVTSSEEQINILTLELNNGFWLITKMQNISAY